MIRRGRPFVFPAASVLMAFLLSSCLSVLENVSLPEGIRSTPRVSVTNEEAIRALKDALVEGIRVSSTALSATDGYFGNDLVKIFLPPDAEPLLDAVSRIPQGQKMLDDVILRINRSAESAAKEVLPIFADAIREMSIADGIAIVRGSNRSASRYLEEKTRAKLLALYQPGIDNALAAPLVMNMSAKNAWYKLTDSYNRVGAPLNAAARLAKRKEPMPPVEVDLARYATNRALDGLFLLVGQEEEKIRANPLAYSSAMIKKVFGALKDGLL